MSTQVVELVRGLNGRMGLLTPLPQLGPMERVRVSYAPHLRTDDAWQ